MNGPDTLREYIQEHVPAAPSTVAGMVELLGGGNARQGRSQLAMILAGTTDKSSKEYRNARRNIERYQVAEGKGARGGKEGRANPVNINKALGAANRELTKRAVEGARGKGILPIATGEVLMHFEGYDDGYSGYRTVYPVAGEMLDNSGVGDMWDAIEKGDYDAAWSALEGVMFDAYDIPGSTFEDIDEFDLGADWDEEEF